MPPPLPHVPVANKSSVWTNQVAFDLFASCSIDSIPQRWMTFFQDPPNRLHHAAPHQGKGSSPPVKHFNSQNPYYRKGSIKDEGPEQKKTQVILKLVKKFLKEMVYGSLRRMGNVTLTESRQRQDLLWHYPNL